ncbi:type IV secretory system conjugative DNA transfer family protein [Bacteroidales bacterium AH-315-N07]|nr:type IV secretory system conjugative DNA transfer family protein [Bacteroidales bacterium AH-315-N07]
METTERIQGIYKYLNENLPDKNMGSGLESFLPEEDPGDWITINAKSRFRSLLGVINKMSEDINQIGGILDNTTLNKSYKDLVKLNIHKDKYYVEGYLSEGNLNYPILKESENDIAIGDLKIDSISDVDLIHLAKLFSYSAKEESNIPSPRLIHQKIQNVEAKVYPFLDENLTDPEKVKLYTDYLKAAFQKLTALCIELQDGFSDFPSEIAFILQDEYTTENKYIEECKKKIYQSFSYTDFFDWTMPVIVSSDARHKYILGGTKSGKSELMKVFIHNDVKTGNGALILDPHGDLVAQCSKFELFNAMGERLVYISPEFASKGYMPCYNPLDHSYHDLPSLQRNTAISIRAQELVNSFETIMQEEFTPNMELLVSNCLRVLLEEKEVTLYDLLDFLHPNTCKDYLKLAKNHWDERVRKYFNNLFNEDRLRNTKSAVITRFSNALSNQYLSLILNAKKSSFNIGNLLDEKKVILVNAAQGILGEEGARVLGSFFVSEITAYALNKATVSVENRQDVHVYIDECQNFLTNRIDKILSEGRKFGIDLTLANQFLGQFSTNGMTRLRKSILANCAVKFCGNASEEDKSIMSKSIGMDITKERNLHSGCFAMKAGNKKPVIVNVNDFLIGDNQHYMNQSNYAETIRKQLNQYYIQMNLDKQATSIKDRDFDLPDLESLI